MADLCSRSTKCGFEGSLHIEKDVGSVLMDFKMITFCNKLCDEFFYGQNETSKSVLFIIAVLSEGLVTVLGIVRD